MLSPPPHGISAVAKPRKLIYLRTALYDIFKPNQRQAKTCARSDEVHVRIPFVGNLITGAGANRIEAVVGVYIAHKVSCGGTMVGRRRSLPVFVEKGLSRIAR